MKIEIIDDKTIIYLKKDLISLVDFTNVDEAEEYFKELLLKLKNLYDMSIKGFYNVKVYIDNIYGMVLELDAENIDYGDYYSQIEMRIIPIYTNFLYQLDDIIDISNTKVYLYKNNLYLKIDNNITLKDYFLVMDHAKIVYNNTDNIIRYGKQLKRFNFNKIML